MILYLIQHFGERGLTAGVLLLLLQCAGTTFLWFRKTDTMKAGHFMAHSVYQDLSTPLLQATVVFVGQVCLIGFYMSSMYTTVRSQQFAYVFWLAPFFCLQMGAFFNRGEDSLLGSVCNVSLWTDLIRNADHAEFIHTHHAGHDEVLQVSKLHLVMRMVYGFIVNSFFREILAFTVPILLAQFTKPLDFVVYCVGVNFIVTIDNMSHKRFDVRLRAGSASYVSVRERQSL